MEVFMVDENPNIDESESEIEIDAAKVTEKIKNINEELAKTDFNGASDDERVKITISGTHDIKSLSIDPELLNESAEVIEDSLIFAYTNAIVDIERISAEKTIEVMESVGIKEYH